MNVFEILNLRYEFEELVRKFRGPKHRHHGTLENMEWFLKGGDRWNFRRPEMQRVLEICKAVIDDETTREKFV